jgi:hypothetical protein
MLFLVDTSSRRATPVEVATLTELRLRERYDVQEWVLATPQLLGEDLLIVSSEFAHFDRTSERIDVLAVDRKGKLVVVELKRSAVGSHADLQGLRYAAYCSTFTLEDVAELYAAHVKMRESRELSAGEAAEEVRGFINAPDFEEFDDKPRIILAAEQFPPEMTAALLWLRSFEVDISAVRLRPYALEGRLLLDSEVLIPLAEAEDFIIRKEKKETRGADKERGKGELYRAWFQPLLDELRDQHGFTNARAAQPQNWYAFSAGIGRIVYSAVFSKEGLRTEVYIDTGDKDENKRLFDSLFSSRAEIEAAFGSPLSWERLDNRRASRIAAVHGVAIEASEQELTEARDWTVTSLLKMKTVFGPRVERLIRAAH